jgi:transposase
MVDIMAVLIDALDRALARAGKRVVRSTDRAGAITVQARSTVRAAQCPSCQSWSGRGHGSYVRHLAERPVLGRPVAIEIRRFKGLKAGCIRRTFAENIDCLAGRHQRRTRSQAKALRALAHALGGQAAARLGAAMGLPTSADTVLRELRRTAPEKKRPAPRVVGIDDWAIKRGHHYGTIVVDLERRKPIAVFKGCETMAVAEWLGDNPSITVGARDRAGAYSEAVETALPAARQISDRWHLLCNLRDNVERMLHRLGPQMRQAAQQVVMEGVTLGRQGRPRGASLAGWRRLSDDRRNARLALYEQVMSLRTQGCTMKAIGRELSIDHCCDCGC